MRNSRSLRVAAWSKDMKIVLWYLDFFRYKYLKHGKFLYSANIYPLCQTKVDGGYSEAAKYIQIDFVLPNGLGASKVIQATMDSEGSHRKLSNMQLSVLGPSTTATQGSTQSE